MNIYALLKGKKKQLHDATIKVVFVMSEIYLRSVKRCVSFWKLYIYFYARFAWWWRKGLMSFGYHEINIKTGGKSWYMYFICLHIYFKLIILKIK